MRIERQIADEAILKELGDRIAHRRVSLGITQAEAADRAGVGKRTIERIEAGGDVQLTTLIRLLRALELMDPLEQLVPQISASPMELLRLRGKRRKRASSRRKVKKDEPWRWGDER